MRAFVRSGTAARFPFALARRSAESASSSLSLSLSLSLSFSLLPTYPVAATCLFAPRLACALRAATPAVPLLPCALQCVRARAAEREQTLVLSYYLYLQLSYTRESRYISSLSSLSLSLRTRKTEERELVP